MANRQPREVSLQRLDITGKTTSDLPGVNANAPDAFSAAIKGFDSLSTQLNSWADKAAVTEAGDAGALAALQQGDNLQLRRDGTLTGAAFDKAATDVRTSQIETAMRNDIFAASEQFKDNPDGLTAELTKQRGNIAGIAMGDPTIQAALEKRFDDLRFPYEKQAIRNRDTKLKQEAAANYGTMIETATTDAKRAAYIFGGDPEGDEKLAKESDRIKRMIENGKVSGYISPSSAARLSRDIDSELEQQKVSGAFDRLQGVEAKTKFLDELDKAYRGGTALTKLDPDAYDKLYNTLGANLRREAAIVKQDARQLATGVESIKERSLQGYGVTPGEWAELDAVAKRSASPSVQTSLAAAKAEAARIDRMWSMQPAELNAAITAEKARIGRTPSPTDLARLTDAETVYAAMAKEAGNDPLALGERTGRIKPTSLSAAIVTADDEAASGAFIARRAAAEHVAADLGVKPKYFLEGERGEWAKVLNAGGDGAVRAADMLTRHLGPDAAMKAIAEVAPKAGVMAQAAAVRAAGGSQSFVADVGRSLAYSQMQGYKPISIAPTKLNAAMRDEYGPAFNAAPAAASRSMEAARVAFDARARDQQLTPDIDSGASKTAFRRTLQEAVGATFDNGVQYGGIAPLNGRKTVLPADVRAGRAGDLIAAISDADLASNPPVASNGKPLRASDLRSAQLVAVSPGRYRVAQGDPDSDRPQWFADGKGQPWVLDLNALNTTLRSRRPDLYRGSGSAPSAADSPWMGDMPL